MESIRQRKAKYCRYLDTKQFDAWEALFMPDAKNQIHNSEIDFTSESEATAIWSMEDWHVHAPQDGKQQMGQHYRDDADSQ